MFFQKFLIVVNQKMFGENSQSSFSNQGFRPNQTQNKLPSVTKLSVHLQSVALCPKFLPIFSEVCLMQFETIKLEISSWPTVLTIHFLFGSTACLDDLRAWCRSLSLFQRAKDTTQFSGLVTGRKSAECHQKKVLSLEERIE